MPKLESTDFSRTGKSRSWHGGRPSYLLADTYPPTRLMSPKLDSQDVLMYVDSHRVIGALPPDAQDEAFRNLQEHGYMTFAFGFGAHQATGRLPYDAGRFGNKPIRENELSDEEYETIRLVWKIAHERGKRVHIVDVAKESDLRRYFQEHLRHLRNYPVLFRVDGRRLEGIQEFTEEKLKGFFSD
jgi:hypothetical protein